MNTLWHPSFPLITVTNQEVDRSEIININIFVRVIYIVFERHWQMILFHQQAHQIRNAYMGQSERQLQMCFVIYFGWFVGFGGVTSGLLDL